MNNDNTNLNIVSTLIGMLGAGWFVLALLVMGLAVFDADVAKPYKVADDMWVFPIIGCFTYEQGRSNDKSLARYEECINTYGE